MQCKPASLILFIDAFIICFTTAGMNGEKSTHKQWVPPLGCDSSLKKKLFKCKQEDAFCHRGKQKAQANTVIQNKNVL